ncbi:metallophosphoesterase family protein [Maribacter algicola]|uniref:Metallophosphoesterase family protein n=1 Tax=Meishania litoralis TaxID=3434685 RepID=A0ACC7LEY8_9FLAO
MKRRNFVAQLGMGSMTTILPSTVLSFRPGASLGNSAEVLRFGIVADVHKDLMPDADQRLQKFIGEAGRKEVDFIVQLGDFCMADPKNVPFLEIWRAFKGPKYHVLGNHDMDRHSKFQAMEFWEMQDPYYSFDFQNFHFIVLDANFLYQDGKFVDYDNSNFYVEDKYRTYINNEQIAWFKSDLEGTELPTIVFSHQSLWHYQWGVKNRLSLQKILEANSEKVVCCMNGHNHIDFHHRQNGIDYIEINSMSYQWMEDKYRNTDRFPEALYKEYKWLPNLAPYMDPLYAFAEIDPQGTMRIEGVKSQWMAPSPYDMGMPKPVYGSEYSAEISDYELRYR